MPTAVLTIEYALWPITEPIVEAAAELIAKPITVPISEPVVEPAIQPLTDAIPRPRRRWDNQRDDAAARHARDAPKVFRRLGDSLVSVPAGSLVLPEEHAKALLAFVRQEVGSGLWVDREDLEHTFYPLLLERICNRGLSWQSVVRALGKITRKRHVELLPTADPTKWRVARWEYWIPRAAVRKRA